jgi:lysophospholipase L1-like esterase
MKTFFIYVILLIAFIIGMSYYNTYMYSKYNESFESKVKEQNNIHYDIILLGDSILKNNSYVEDGKGIDQLLKERNIANIHSFAINNSHINDIYSQITSIPSDLNKNSTYIFLSAGGNDILENFVENEPNEEKNQILNTIFKAYKNLVKSIQTKMNNSKLILLDIYYPTNIKYSQHHPIIQKWNQKLEDFKNQNSSNIYDVLNSSKLLTSSNDFTFDIEPSSSGGKKLVNEMVNYFQ